MSAAKHELTCHVWVLVHLLKTYPTVFHPAAQELGRAHLIHLRLAITSRCGKITSWWKHPERQTHRLSQQHCRCFLIHAKQRSYNQNEQVISESVTAHYRNDNCPVDQHLTRNRDWNWYWPMANQKVTLLHTVKLLWYYVCIGKRCFFNYWWHL